MDGPACILCCRETQYGYLAGFRINLDIANLRRHAWPHARWGDPGAADDGSARGRFLGRDFRQW